MEVVKWVPPGHGDVHQGSREEDEVVAGRRGAVEHGGGISVLRETFGGSVRFKIPWYDSDVFG